MMHRCNFCGRTWPLYNPRTLFGGLRGILRLPRLVVHSKLCQRRQLRVVRQRLEAERKAGGASCR